MHDEITCRESERLIADGERRANWKRWGPYLSERQWGTVREDYSATGECWDYLPHDHARSRSYRWGEDGLLGICDRQCRLCFAIGLWNGKDPIIKERLFGLTGPEGNHGEDVKELYYYLDATPTYSYMKGLYKYPQNEYPYGQLVHENRHRGKLDPELELLDTGVMDHGYWDVSAEYAKAAPEDILIRITVTNRGPEEAELDLLGQLWFRNTWSWGRTGEGYWGKPRLNRDGRNTIVCSHESLGRMRLHVEREADPDLLFTENETNTDRLFGIASPTPYVKDAFHEYIVHGRTEALHPAGVGTKAAAHYKIKLAPGAQEVLRLRLVNDDEFPADPFSAFDDVFNKRFKEANHFYDVRSRCPDTDQDAKNVTRQAYAGLLWTNQFFYYDVKAWLDGDPNGPPPPDSRKHGRNRNWSHHLYNRDIISMPDKWEYPWYAAWDLAFHMIPFARIDPDFAKKQLLLFTREWYMHPNGQIPAYEFALGDVNPPVHAWAAWRIYKMTGRRGFRDTKFLARIFQKLLLNFTWWVNRKDENGENLFSGGFLGLDNIGIFDRSQQLPSGGRLQQADGTAWMAFYSSTMLSMALELAYTDPVYADMASKFFEHFVRIVDAMNSLGGTGLWDDRDGFYYDQLTAGGETIPLRTRSMVGVIPLFGVEVLEDAVMERLPGFKKRTQWFLENRADLARHISYMVPSGDKTHGHHLLAVPSRDRLVRVLRYVLDESEFLSPYGVRSLSKVHEANPYVFNLDGNDYRVDYVPGESETGMFGGNSNWRGPVWFPLNYLLIESLERYHHFYGDSLKVECPTGSGQFLNLEEVATELSLRLCRLFLKGDGGRRPCHGADQRYTDDPNYSNLVLFYEYFHGETGRGIGASHQTGWTALVARLFENLAHKHKGAAARLTAELPDNLVLK